MNNKESSLNVVKIERKVYELIKIRVKLNETIRDRGPYETNFVPPRYFQRQNLINANTVIACSPNYCISDMLQATNHLISTEITH